MMTLQGMRNRTNHMMEMMRFQAIDEAYHNWRKALRNYYTNGYDNGETTKYYKELEELGVDTEQLIDEDLDIRDEVFSLN